MRDPAWSYDAPPSSQAPALRLAEVLLIGLVFFVIAGDPPPGLSEPHYLSRLKHFWNPAWCAGDLFLESTDTQLAFIWTFGWSTRWLSLSATAWIGRAVVWTLLAWAWQRLSWRLVPRPLASVLSAALFVTLMRVADLAGEWVVGGIEAKVVAYVFVLLALHEMVQGRWNAVGLLLGTACAFHPLVGGWSGLVGLGVWILDDRQRVPFRSMLPGCMAGGLVALIGILPASRLTRDVPVDVVAEAARIYVFERLPHHLALLTLPAEESALRFARHAALVIALWLLVRGARRLGESAWALRRIAHFAWGALIVALLGLGIEVALWNDPLVAARLLRYYWFRLTDFAVPLAVALHGLAILAAGLERRRAWAAWGLAAALVSVVVPLSHVAGRRLLDPLPPADRMARDPVAWVDACAWIAENTPADVLVLTPRSSHSFKWRAGRAEVATWKDVPQDAGSLVEWHRRTKDVFTRDVQGRTAWVDSPSALGTERVRELARRYGFDYVLADRAPPLALPEAYRNGGYVVYRIPD